MSSYYTSLTGLKNAQTQLNVTSNNIANAETNGFKKSTTSFADIVSSSFSNDQELTVGIGSRVQNIQQNFDLGSVEQTGGALDMAVDGDGFFTVTSPTSGETQYTRDGAFTLDASGYIQTTSGARLQVFAPVTSGAVTSGAMVDAQIPTTNAAGSAFSNVTIDTQGQIVASYDDGSTTTIGTIALASFVAPTGLKQEGSSTWTATGKSGTATYGTANSGSYGSLMSGTVERSNVDLSEELVELISAQRYFQANAKAIDTATQISETIINLRT